MTKRSLLLIGLLLCLTLGAGAQSPRFKLGKWTEIQTAILQELNRSYVDSLPVDRIERRGVDAMLADLDPYTVYIPEEENEDLQMLIHKSYGGIGAVIYKPDVQGNVIINEPYANAPAQKYGLVCGDEIMAIDGETVVGLTSQQCSEKMRGDPGTQVVFHVKKLRSGEEVGSRTSPGTRRKRPPCVTRPAWTCTCGTGRFRKKGSVPWSGNGSCFRAFSVRRCRMRAWKPCWIFCPVSRRKQHIRKSSGHGCTRLQGIRRETG